MSKWVVDQRELDEARYFLGIDYPVIVIPSLDFAGKYHGIGYWGPAAMSGRLLVATHQFSISADTSAEFANSVAWHELTHAAQAESFMPDEDEFDPADYNGWERWQVGINGFTQAYADESRHLGGYSSHGPNSSYTNISFEREASSSGRYAKEVQFLVPAPNVEADDESEFVAWDRYRVDVTPLVERKYPFGYSSEYVFAYSDKSARAFVIDRYNRQGVRVDSWDVYTYACPRWPDDPTGPS